MLVGHDAVEAHLVRQLVLLVVLVVEYRRLLRVEVGVGKAKAARFVLLQVLVAYMPVGLFGEPIDLGMICGAF